MSNQISLRRRALSALMNTTDNGAYANLAVKEATSGLLQDEAKWVTALFYNTLDNLIYIDKVIDSSIKSKLDKKIRGVLRLGVCQLFMAVPERAAVNESVKLTKEIGKAALSGYVNAVMRAVAAKKESPLEMPKESRERISIQYSFPRYLVDMYADEYGEEFTEAMLSCKHKGTVFRLVKPFDGEGLPSLFKPSLFDNARYVDDGFDVLRNELFQNGNITVQSLSSMLVCHALNAKAGMCVLDACAAPGGKTAYISEMMEQKGEVVATELHEHRAELTKKTLERLNVKNASVLQKDASKLCEEFVEKFDAVLVDAPCSGLGVTGKADIKYTKSMEAIEELARLQYEILSNCAKYVKRGGTLVYSTCTVSKKENEENAAKFLKEHPDFLADDTLKDLIPDNLRKRVKDGRIQLFPHIDNMEGFFIARFQKWT